MRLSLLLAPLLATLVGCVDGEGLDVDQAALDEGSAEAVGVLRFLNGPAADLATLDVTAGLDARAARNIVAQVRGGDGLLGSADDRPLASIAELDAIAWVGPATIDRLVVYLESIGGVPRLVVEGVRLTETEAAAMVAAGNGASLTELDDDAALDARAARNLVDGRPFGDVHALAAVSYVGASALDRLRRWAPGWTGPTAPACDPAVLQSLRDCVDHEIMDQMVGMEDGRAFCVAIEAHAPCVAAFEAELARLCRVTDDCAGAPVRCQGVPSDGSSPLGVCVDTTAVGGEGEACAAATDCAAGLVCAGLTIWDDGSCVAGWMAGTFAVDLPVSLSGASGATAESRTVVRGLATVPVDIEVEIDLGGADARGVRFDLTDPGGDRSPLWAGTAATLPARLLPGNGISRDAAINGWWTLTATSIGGGAPVTVRGWRLHLTSRWD